jgi:hypothetical protein
MSALLARAMFILQSMPAVKFVIELPDGTRHTQGDLKLEEVKQKHRILKYPIGSICLYYKPYLENLLPGGLVEIPFGTFAVESLRSGISAYCVDHWGKGCAMTATNHSKKCVEVLRLA